MPGALRAAAAVMLAGAFVYSLGLVFAPLYGRRREYSTGARGMLRSFSFAGSLGITLNLLLVFVFGSLDTAFLAGGTIIAIGLALNAGALKKIGYRKSGPEFFLFAAFILVVAVMAVFTPISKWDARSIWFFHGKMIFYADGFRLDPAWLNPLISFSHVDYPKGLPVIAAEVAKLAGFWNEYLPKGALAVIAAPALAGLMSFGGGRRMALLAVLALLPGAMLWNGMMDGYLALYALLAALRLVEWASEGDEEALASALASIGVMAVLKNEGLVLGAVLLISFSASRLWNVGREEGKAEGFGFSGRIWVVAAAVFASPALWWFLKKTHGLRVDIIGGAGGVIPALARASERISDPHVLTGVLWAMAADPLSAFAALSAAALWTRAKVRGKMKPSGIYPLAASGFIYALVLAAVYLVTPHDLDWHLEKSVDRVMMPVAMMFFAACVVFADGLGKNADKQALRQGGNNGRESM